MRCADCNDSAEWLVTCDDAMTRCVECAAADGFCVRCGRNAPTGICNYCFNATNNDHVRRTGFVARSAYDDIHRRYDQVQAALRQIRRWIESEEQPGEHTSKIYEVAGKFLEY